MMINDHNHYCHTHTHHLMFNQVMSADRLLPPRSVLIRLFYLVYISPTVSQYLYHIRLFYLIYISPTVSQYLYQVAEPIPGIIQGGGFAPGKYTAVLESDIFHFINRSEGTIDFGQGCPDQCKLSIKDC